jgi:NmrA-like family/NADPH-dependent FMN reductase
MTSDRTILITGVTGNQGGAVAQALEGTGFDLRGLTRKPDSQRAAALACHGIGIVKGDLDDEATLRRALAGAWGVFAVLKNAIDWVYPEWNRKAAAFVSYGSAMGARAVQQLRETAIEVQMAPIRSSVHIPVATLWAHFQGGDVGKGLAELEKQAKVMIDDLLWWTAALKTARER